MNTPFLFFDLDNTLLDFNWAEQRALRRAFQEAGLEPTPALLARYHAINIRQWELLEEGALTREQVLVSRFELLFAERGISLSAKAVDDRYEALLAEGHRFVPGAEALLDSLRGRTRMFIASNGCAAVQAGRIASAGIAPYFEKIFISEELGADKPSRAFFQRCFAEIPGFDPAHALMIGDSLTSDIRGGINAGIRTCWFNPQGKPARADIVPDFEIRALAELPALLERL